MPASKSFFYMLFMVSAISCVEPLNSYFVDFESVLVVGASITDEFKNQKILLTRSYEFDDTGPTAESDATISITNETGDTFSFVEAEPGIYVSENPFAAVQDRFYTLNITTRNGKSYQSSPTQMGSKSSMDSLFAKRIINDKGAEGIGIFINSSSEDSETNFYRYEYEETYKIIAPDWVAEDFYIDEETEPWSLFLGPRSIDKRICYGTNNSTDIILANTNNLSGGELKNLPLHFVNRNSFTLIHRYSILARQISQVPEAYDFYQRLDNLSTSESILSQIQPGYLAGNIVSQDSQDDKILGYFNIVSVDEKRIFFEFEDFFPNEDLPEYVDPCKRSSPRDGLGLVLLVQWGELKYLRENGGEFPDGGSYVTVPFVCGDCTSLGTSEVPSFWID